jgi:hypothetical protein
LAFKKRSSEKKIPNLSGFFFRKKIKNFITVPKKERLVWTTVHVQEVQSSVLENLHYCGLKKNFKNQLIIS